MAAEELVRSNKEVFEILEQIKHGNNFLLSGGAGSGKTYSLVQVLQHISELYPSAQIAFVICIEQHLQDALGIVGIDWLLGGQVGLKGSHKLIHLHRQSPPDKIQAQKTGLLHGVAVTRFGPQTDPEPPSPHQSFQTDHRATP